MVVASRTTTHTRIDLLATTAAEVTVADVEATAAATEEDIRAVVAETGRRTTRMIIARSGTMSSLEMGRSVR
jgi:hypothetical protein